MRLLFTLSLLIHSVTCHWTPAPEIGVHFLYRWPTDSVYVTLHADELEIDWFNKTGPSCIIAVSKSGVQVYR